MKKITTLIAIVIISLSGLFAQTPEAFKYQAVARASSGAIMDTEDISVKISIIEMGVEIYEETHNVTTNQFGLFTLNIGEGTIISGNFATINWADGTYSVQVALDENNGTDYVIMGASPLLTVPYAMHAKTAENTFSGNYNDLNNTPNLAGDVTGSIDNNTVDKIQGMDISANIPGDGQILKWNNTTQTWAPADDALGAAGTTDGVVNSIEITGTTTKTVTLSRSNGLSDLTATFTDIDNDTQLNETQVDNFVSNNGYLTSFTEIDGSTTNELQDLSLSGTTLSIENGNNVNLSGIDTDTHLTEAQVDAYVSDNGYLTTLTAGDGIEITGTSPNLTISATQTQKVAFRWNVFDTYLNNEHWMLGNNPSLFGGVTAANWTDGEARASNISHDKELQRTLFNKKLYPGKNAMVYSNVYYQYSSTTGKVVAVLIRIKNTTASNITWPIKFYYTANDAWGELASIALNGASIATYTSSDRGTEYLSIPANRTSTVIIVSTSDTGVTPVSQIYVRSCALAFYDNCLALPAGLEFVDDLDSATGGWEQ